MRADFRDLSAGTRARIDALLTESQRRRLPRTGGRLPEDFPLGPGPQPDSTAPGTPQPQSGTGAQTR
jgi:hypothetical protein